MNLINTMQYGDAFKNSYTYIFDDIILPDGIEKEQVINTILDKSALYEPIYEDLDVFKMKVDNHFIINFDIYKRLKEAFDAEYDPLSNYDRYEDWADDGKTESTANDSARAEGQVSAFNSNTYQPQNLSTTSGTATGTTDSKANRKGHVWGNIGVMSAQDMLEKELNIRPKLNIYEVIANDFFNKFMLWVF